MSDYTVETYERNGLDVEIYYDTDAESPLEWTEPSDRAGNVHFALKHNRYTLPFEIEADTADYDSWTELADAVTGKGGELAGYNYKFVRWYEHSGVSVSLRDDEGGADWDAGIAGVIFGETTDDIEREFEPWSAYTSGEVYGYMITNPRADDEVVDSCCGFYGYDDAKQCADGEADAFQWPHEAAYAKNANIIHGGK